MSKSGPEYLKMETTNTTEDHIEKIASLFPNVITEIEDDEGILRKGIDFDLLRQELSGGYVEGREERYDFTWVGKRKAIVEANRPIKKTLRPCMEESKNWEDTQNIFIEGDNLDAMKLLQESYLNSVKMIYIDPPYNTGNDFIYNDRFVMDADEYDEETGAVDDAGNRMFKNNKERGRYHSDWCSMLYPRLKLAHTLLRDDGVIFLSIDEHEMPNLRHMMNEIFGEDNYIESIIWKKRSTPPNDKIIGAAHEYILIYSKDIQKLSLNLRERTNEQIERYQNPDNHPKGPWVPGDLMANVKGGRYVKSLNFPIINPNTGEEHYPSSNGNWRFNKDKIDELIKNNEIYFGKDNKGRPKLKRFLSDVKKGITYTTIWDFVPFNTVGSKEMAELLGNLTVFNNPKPSGLIVELLKLGSLNNSLILDFFSGSCTTAHAVMQLNAEDGGSGTRKFIMVQLPEPCCDEGSEALKAGFHTIAEIGKERIRRAGEKIKAELEEANRQKTLDGEQMKIPDIGFRVFKIDDTNMKDVYYAAEDYTQETIEGLVDNVRGDRTDTDLLYQVMINWGLPLDLRHEMETIDGYTVHIVDGNALVACFEANISEDVMRTIAEKKPLRAVFRDGSFRNSPGKLNIEGIFKTIAPDTKLRVI
ncbi:site-specific DNA-methyltransferase [Methanogenium sp. S4BF]|uniref:site-specific DNA-methyltransferase n=1 Tax=Methanogenium sp. S4BF TaxID=1789226 RepID=UPI0024160071|nr:site-specific DNA-methyltransferase [Methanogenium sp. S4BF]WFN33467.1 site-specific DNA-methyltransferase [Methanogenium sp. S4BF]